MKKVVGLAGALRRDPREFVDRVVAIAEGRLEPLRAQPPDYAAAGWNDAAAILAQALGAHFTAALEEPALHEVEACVRDGVSSLAGRAPYTMVHNADAALARCCYAVCRALRARRVVETGVGYGVTTSYVLRALRENGGGALHSIDLPPVERGAEEFAGALVPAELRAHWTLHRGTARRALDGVLAQIGAVDLFMHDSMHTCENMRFEFTTAWPRLRDGAVVVADDVQGNAAFAELCARDDAGTAVVVRQEAKPALFGVVVKRLRGERAS